MDIILGARKVLHASGSLDQEHSWSITYIGVVCQTVHIFKDKSNGEDDNVDDYDDGEDKEN